MGLPDVTDQAGFWAEHGLPGLVIFALFILIGLIAWAVYLSVKSILESNRTASEKLHEEHRKERGEWKAALTEQTDKLQGSLADLANAIRNSKL